MASVAGSFELDTPLDRPSIANTAYSAYAHTFYKLIAKTALPSAPVFCFGLFVALFLI